MRNKHNVMVIKHTAASYRNKCCHTTGYASNKHQEHVKSWGISKVNGRKKQKMNFAPGLTQRFGGREAVNPRSRYSPGRKATSKGVYSICNQQQKTVAECPKEVHGPLSNLTPILGRSTLRLLPLLLLLP